MAIESVGGSIISKIAELMVEPVGRQFRYMFCFNNFVEEFKERKENLALALDGLQKVVEAAERNAEEIKKGTVKKWLEDANKEIEGAKPLENEIGKNGNCFTWCPNCMPQFKLSKALAKKSETFTKLQENSTKFTKVSDIAHPQPIEFLPSKEFTSSKSSEEAFEQIMDALKDDKVDMIGLCGMGGVGKTTLVKEVGRRAKELQLFPEFLMATVSQNPNVTDIQHQMADKLGLDIKEKSREGRADRLWQRLKEVEKMLIILDDVWEYIDLKEIGIPLVDDHRGCKILLTTRLEHICSSVECQQKVFLGVLSEDEALALFRINAGLRDGDSTLYTAAREVARECQGLPIALVTVGKALRDKSVVEWELAIRQLKNSHFPGMEHIDEQRTAYACLKKSETFRELGEISKKFETVSHRAPPQPIEFLPSKEFMISKSSEEAFEQIMKALKDDSVNMIGLYGTGGVGKTTLVKEVGRRAKELQLFPEVLMATVSQNPNVTDIQHQMADKLGLDIKEKSREGRADRLWQRLKEVEKMLIILDDVWEYIDLKEIGIPLGDDHRGCKILLTTRLEHICSSMECQQKVFLGVLSEDEALALFRINAGLRDGDSTLNTVAREVARECQGLPIALVTVGRALRDKSENQWKRVSKQLKNSQFPDMEQIDEQKNAYAV